MRLTISHETRYGFQTPPAYGLQQIRLTAHSGKGQIVRQWELDIQGADIQSVFEDEHQNTTHLLAIAEGAEEIVIRSQGEVDMIDTQGITGDHDGQLPLWLFLQETPLTKSGREVKKLAAMLSSEAVVGQFHKLSNSIAERVSYQTGTTEAQTSAEQAIALGQGVCQDHAHIFIAAARHAGHPARYVSGYLMMNDRVEQDATHAWAEVFIDGLGWTGFDVSNGISPDMRYVRIATGLDYTQAAPISGIMIGGSGESLSVSVNVQQ